MLGVHVLITSKISNISKISPIVKEGKYVLVLVVVVVSTVHISTMSSTSIFLAFFSLAFPSPSPRWIIYLGVVTQRLVGLGGGVWLGFSNFRATSVNLSGAVKRFD